MSTLNKNYSVQDYDDKGLTIVLTSFDYIDRGDWYLCFDKKGNVGSIELCDSQDLTYQVNGRRKSYLKIISANKKLWHDNATYIYNEVLIDPNLKQ